MSGWSLKSWFAPSALVLAVRECYRATVDQARNPVFYRDWHVPDSAIGRFDVIALHCFLVLHRLKGEPRAQKFAEAYCGALFDDMDRNLREMGVGDLSVGKKVRKLAEGFYGRAAAYEVAVEGDAAGLCDALRRNLYAGDADEESVLRFAGYVRRNVECLASQDIAALTEGRVVFAPPHEESDR